MTISWRVQQQFFSPSGSSKSDEIIRLPLTLLDQIDYWSFPVKANHTAISNGASNARRATQLDPPKRRANLWTADEHDRFLRGLELFPRGPWKRVASVVRTKSTRQTMTHAQKYRQKIERHQRLTASAYATAETPRPPRPQPRYRIEPPAQPRPTSIVAGTTLTSDWGENELSDIELLALLDCLEPLDEPDPWFAQLGTARG